MTMSRKLRIVLLAGFVLGKLSNYAHLPGITGYLLAGVAFGPSCLGILQRPAVENLTLINSFALTLIALTAGGEVSLAGVRRRLYSFAWITAGQSAVTLLGVLLTAVLALPQDDKSGTILRGRYLAREETRQIVRPADVIDGLLQNIFRIKNVLDAVISVVALATILAIILVFALSLRLRQREIQTIFKLGCRRATIARLLAAEIFIIVVMSGVFCGALMWLVNQFSTDLVRMLFIR